MSETTTGAKLEDAPRLLELQPRRIRDSADMMDGASDVVEHSSDTLEPYARASRGACPGVIVLRSSRVL